MNLLIGGLLLLIHSSLAMGAGLNTAILPRKFHFGFLITNNVRNEYKLVYKRHDEWINEGVPLWCFDTITKGIRWL